MKNCDAFRHILMYQIGNTALMFAAATGHAALVTLLLDKGASIDSADKVKSLSERGMRCVEYAWEGGK